MESIKLWARNGEAVRQAIELGELVHMETASEELTDEFLLEGVSDLLITYQTATPNSYRLIKSPITKSCMRSVLEKQIVRRTNRLIRVRKLMCLLSIFWVFSFPT
jgi:hypothetical protein